MSSTPAVISIDAVQESQLTNTPPASPRLVERGPYLWDVRIEGRFERWELDCAYGKFPVGMRERFVYRGRTYSLQRAWYGILDVALEQDMEAQAAETRALAGV